MLSQVAAFNAFHNQVRAPVCFANFVDLHDVWMTQSGGRLSFDAEPYPFLLASNIAR